MVGDVDRMAPVAEALLPLARRSYGGGSRTAAAPPTFVFPAPFFSELESLIGKELEGRIYADSSGRRVKFHLDLSEHAGFQLDEGDRSL